MVTLVNRAKMSITSTGTGTPITLGSAEDGYQSFADAGVSNGDVVRYVIEDGDNWEIGSGTYTASGTTLTRSVTESNNSNNRINLTADAVIFITAEAGDIQQPPSEGAFADGDKTKLDGIESGATADQTASEILTAIKTVDGGGSGLDADTLDGVQGSSFLRSDTADTASGTITFTTEQHFGASYSDPDSGVARDAKFGDNGIAVSGGIKTDTISITNDGAGSGIDADLLDGQHASAFLTAHPNISAASSSDNSGRTYIQDITLDSNGHVTGIATATETVTNTNQLTTFQLEDGDGTEVTISHGKEVKFVEGGGIDINWTDTSTGSDGDPYDLTFTHADTSSQASVDNSNGTVIQDVTLDGYGHVTGLASVNLDGRYYTETEADSRFVNVTGDTMTGRLVLPDGGYSIGNEYHTWKRQYTVNSSAPAELLYHDGNSLPAGGAYRFHAHIDGTGTDQSATAVYWNQNGTWKVNVTYQSGTSSNHPEFIIAGTPEAPYIHIDHTSNYNIQVLGERLELSEGTGTDNLAGFGADAFLGSVSGTLRYNNAGSANGYNQGNVVFHDGYHPNADKWTTARTLSLSGDASGSVSWDGSANATLSVTVADDSHNHDGRYYTETEADSRFVNVTGDTMTGALVLRGQADDYDGSDRSSYWDYDGNVALALEPAADNGATAILFKSVGNSPSDFGYIVYDEDYPEAGVTSGEVGALILSSQNDGTGSSDHVRVKSRLVVEADMSSSDPTMALQVKSSNTTSDLFSVARGGAVKVGTNSVFHDGYHPNADKWTSARTLSLSGDASGSVSWDGSANATLSVTVADDSHSHSNYAQTNASSVTFDGGTSTTVNVKCDDSGMAMVRANGDNQGTGAVEVGQSNSYGGGMSYNGDSNPAFASGETSDNITFYRLDNGTRTEVFHYPYNSNTVNFNATPTVGGSSVWHAGNDGAGSGLDADLLDGQHGSYYATADHNHTYNVNNAWLRENGDNAHVKLYGNSRQMAFRTDGTTEYSSGVGGYPFAWMYGGDASSQRIMLLNTSGDLYTKENGWLSTALSGKLSTTGKAADSNLLDGIDSSAFLRSNTSDTLTSGTLSVDGKIKINSGGSLYYETSSIGGYIPRPNGGHSLSTSSNTGAIEIAMPINGATDMISFYVDIYDYSTNESVSVFVAGYQYGAVGSSNTWAGCEARVLTTNSSKNYNVRFGDNGTVPVVWIGETNTTWPYTQILVRDVQVGYSADVDNWDDGWDISFVTTLGTVDELQTNNWPLSHYANSAGSATTATNSTQLGGFAASDYIRTDTAARLFSLTINSSGTDITKDLYNDLIIRNSGTGTDDGVILSTYGSGAQRTALKAFGGSNSYVAGYHNGSERFKTNANGLIVTGYMYTSEGIAHDGDTNTYLSFSDDRAQFYAGGVEMLDMVEGTTDYVDIVDRVRVTAGGDMICEGDITAYTTTSVSDERRKDNIQVIDNALDKVSQLKGVTFNWKHNDTASAGLIAQDVEKVLPEVVVDKEIRDEGTYKTVDYDGVIGLLVESIKELKAEIEVLKNGSSD